jgi:hypothetical protein
MLWNPWIPSAGIITFTAVYDACVLYPALLRDLLRRLSLSMLTAPLSRV